ncbi:MAG: phosphatidylglycerol lysyltransferase domain-containing protein [Elusimicrobiota bacterium]
MIPQFPNFIPLSFEMKDEVLSYLLKYQPQPSELTLGILYGYRDTLKINTALLNGYLCLDCTIENERFMFSPIGPKENADGKIVDIYTRCLDYYKSQKINGEIVTVTNDIAYELRKSGKFNITDDRDNDDYIYLVSSLTNLEGQKYHSKKNFVLQFKKRYKYEYRALETAAQLDECLALQQKWCKERKCEDNLSLHYENICTAELLKHFHELHLFGGVIMIDDKIQGFTIAETTEPSTAIVHIEKAEKGFHGIYQALNNLFCEHALMGKYEYINREQDLGIPGLRKAKLSYHPVKMVEKFTIEIQ